MITVFNVVVAVVCCCGVVLHISFGTTTVSAFIITPLTPSIRTLSSSEASQATSSRAIFGRFILSSLRHQFPRSRYSTYSHRRIQLVQQFGSESNDESIDSNDDDCEENNRISYNNTSAASTDSLRQRLEDLTAKQIDDGTIMSSDEYTVNITVDDILNFVTEMDASCEDASSTDKQTVSSDDEVADDGVDFESTENSYVDKHVVNLPKPPPLTHTDQERRTVEMAILRSLDKSDESLEALWGIWYSERGSRAREQLQIADEYMGVQKYDEAILVLVQLVQQFGVYFCEPINRLATACYMQGRYTESMKLCRIVLEIKPWHIGALSGIVQVYIMLNDRDNARHWAERRMPTLASSTSFPPFDASELAPINPRRTMWVRQSMVDARYMLDRAAERTKRTFGKLEPKYSAIANKEDGDKSSGKTIDTQDTESWQ